MAKGKKRVFTLSSSDHVIEVQVNRRLMLLQLNRFDKGALLRYFILYIPSRVSVFYGRLQVLLLKVVFHEREKFSAEESSR